MWPYVKRDIVRASIICDFSLKFEGYEQKNNGIAQKVKTGKRSKE